MAFIDGIVVNVALLALQENLNVTILDAQRAVGSYALFLAALFFAGASMGDRFANRVFSAPASLSSRSRFGGKVRGVSLATFTGL